MFSHKKNEIKKDVSDETHILAHMTKQRERSTQLALSVQVEQVRDYDGTWKRDIDWATTRACSRKI